MKRFWALTLGTLFCFTLAPQLGAAPQVNRQRDREQERDRVCVYKDIQYQGVEQCFNPGDEIATLQSFNGRASSIRIYGRATVTVFDDTNFRGHTIAFTSSVPDLGQVRLDTKSWSDRIQSLRVTAGASPAFGRSQGAPPPPPPSQISEGICVYERPNYEGRSQCWGAGEELSDLARTGNWNDRISSIRVFGRATAMAYRDTGFGGVSFVVDRDIADLAEIPGRGFRSWDHQISSLRIENERDNGRGRGRGRER
jgi:hypothetical protein